MTQTTQTIKQQVQGATAIIMAIAETIRELGSVPSGTLYAQLCGKMSLGSYQNVISTLERAGLVENKSHILIWIGPQLEKR